MMCPVASLAGADAAPPPSRRFESSLSTFARADAARIVGVAPARLTDWERSLWARADLDLGPSLTLADLVALSVLAIAARHLGEFTPGFAGLFQALRDRPDIERLDDHVALVGRDLACIVELGRNRVRCAGDDFLVIPLAPILTGLRDQVFA
jgi:hypothetical protein